MNAIPADVFYCEGCENAMGISLADRNLCSCSNKECRFHGRLFLRPRIKLVEYHASSPPPLPAFETWMRQLNEHWQARGGRLLLQNAQLWQPYFVMGLSPEEALDRHGLSAEVKRIEQNAEWIRPLMPEE